MNTLTKRILSFGLVAVLSISMLTGCFSKESDVNSGGPQVLRILGGWGDDDYLRREWTDIYELRKDNVEIEIISLNEPYNPNQTEEEREEPRDRIKRLLTEGIPPDIILLDHDISMLNFLVEEGLVQPLDTLIEKSSFDVNSLVPAVREGIKAAGDGTSMYALAPAFSSEALFYNKNLFDQYGVPYPTDQMTWTQIADLAKQFPKEEGEDKIYGLWSPYGNVSLYEFMRIFAGPLELNMFDAEKEKVVMNTPEWEAALSEYISFYEDGIFPRSPERDVTDQDGVYEWTPEMENFHNAFPRGKAAMAILDSWALYTMENTRMYDPDAEEFDWDVVTVPTHASAPGIGGTINYRGLMAINRNSQNTNLAWDFISFVNSEKMLKIKSREPGQFTSVADLNLPEENAPANIQAFFSLIPVSDPFGFYSDEKLLEVLSIVELEIGEVLKSDKTVQEALEEIEIKGQEALEAVSNKAP